MPASGSAPAERRPGERGAALLVVLLLVAVIGAITATAFEKLRLSTALAVNSRALDQARAFAFGIESLLTLTIDDLLAVTSDRTTLAGGWNGGVRRVPLPGGGLAEARVRDGGNCFNVNSVAEGAPPGEVTPRAAGIAQFASLMVILGISEREARGIAEAAGDWVDSDSDPSRAGAEDPAYARGDPPYRVGNTLFAEVGELRALAGMSNELYERMRPWLCALPTTDLSPINVNTLAPDQAPLLAMLAPERIPVAAAQSVIAARPAAGWGSAGEFWRTPPLDALLLPFEIMIQPAVRTRWFAVDIEIALDGAELTETVLVDARIPPSRVIVRRWGEAD